jgi:carboxyl-terminal processing protease
MPRPYLRTARWILMPIFVACLVASTLALRADPVPGKQDPVVVQLVCQYLQKGHLSRPEMNDELSQRLFRKFIKTFDPAKVYFTRSDIDEFKKSEGELKEQLLQGDMSFAYTVYRRFLTRLDERMKLIDELVKDKHDFTVKEYLPTDFDSVDFPSTDEEVRDRWRKRIKFDLLLQRLGPKPVPEAEVKPKVLERYKGLAKRWKQLDNYDLMELYLSDLTTSVDPHSQYMSPSTVADFDIAMRLQLEGIGALLRSDNGNTVIAEIIPGGAASKDGRLKPNDKIIGVAQGDNKFVDVMDMKLTETVKLIRGARGTKVELKVVPTGKIEPIVYALTRQKVELKAQEARGEIIEQGKKADGKPYRIGVIDLPSFYADMAAAKAGHSEYKSATEDVRKILKEFSTKGVDGVVLDLRRNGGGALTEALALTGLFIDQGPVVQVKDSQGKIQRGDDPDKGIVYGGPLMVLVSRFSASASEILAGALQDYGRALIVGDSATHGKGTVQVVIDLGNQVQSETPVNLGALKLTIQQFYRVDGDSTQARGVASDIVLPSLTEELAAKSSEKDLEYALPFDRIAPAEHEEMGLVPAELKAELKARSTERVKKSADFIKVRQEIEQLKARNAMKTVPLNEKELREQLNKEEAEKLDEKAEGVVPDETPHDDVVFKFKRSFYHDEVLKIMEDWLASRRVSS